MSKKELTVIETYRSWTILLDADRGHYYGSRDLAESRATGTMDICGEATVAAVRAGIDAIVDYKRTPEDEAFLAEIDAGTRDLTNGK